MVSNGAWLCESIIYISQIQTLLSANMTEHILKYISKTYIPCFNSLKTKTSYCFNSNFNSESIFSVFLCVISIVHFSFNFFHYYLYNYKHALIFVMKSISEYLLDIWIFGVMLVFLHFQQAEIQLFNT